MDKSNTAAAIIAEHEQDLARFRAVLRVLGVVAFAAGIVGASVALSVVAIAVAP